MKYLLLICALMLALLPGCAPPPEQAPPEQAPPEQAPPEPAPEPESTILYERDGITIAIPAEYADKLLIDPEFPEDDEQGYIESGQDKPLIKVYQKASFEVYPGAGCLFSIWRYSQAQYEKFLAFAEGSGQSFFARDDSCYYGFFFATSVPTPNMADWPDYQELFAKVGDFVKEDMIKRNGLTPYSDEEFWRREYTYEGEHIFLRYYPYAALNGKRDVVWTLVLSQPVKQGAGGIWCVERWFEGVERSQAPYIYPYFPDMGKPAMEHYSELQASCDAGHNTAMLDPYQVGLAFVNACFGHDRANLESFEAGETP